MNLSRFRKLKIPDLPGVYFFLGRNRKILYIGRATSLRHRIRSYFDGALEEKRSPLIGKMVEEAKAVEWTITDSVLEAMLLETNLIRTQKPDFNTLSKDDKSYNHVVITNEEYPRILVLRGKDVAELDEGTYATIYGPFPSGKLFKDALKILRKLFRYYDKEAPSSLGSRTPLTKMSRGKLDFNRQIGLYPNNMSKKEYAQTIRHIRLFFEGKKETIIKELEREMLVRAKKEQFEEAEILKRKIFSLQHIQDVALISDDSRQYIDDRALRIEGYDIAHLHGEEMIGVMVVVDADRNPQKSEYRRFKIKGYDSPNDTGALREVLERRLGHTEWRRPDLVVIDGGTAQKNTAIKVFKKHQVVVPIVSVVKDERHRPRQLLGASRYKEKFHDAILFANAEAHRFAIAYHREKRRKRFR